MFAYTSSTTMDKMFVDFSTLYHNFSWSKVNQLSCYGYHVNSYHDQNMNIWIVSRVAEHLKA